MSDKNAIFSGAETSAEKSIGFSRWRGANTSIMLIAFFLPWVTKCSGGNEVYTGYELTFYSGNDFVALISGVAFIVYVGLNLARAINGKQPHRAWLIITVVGSGIFLFQAWAFSDRIYVGFYLALGGVLSSAFLELFERSIRNKYFLRQLKWVVIVIFLLLVIALVDNYLKMANYRQSLSILYEYFDSFV